MLQFSDHFDPAEWDKTVSSLGGTVFHSSSWARYSTAVRTNLSDLYITCHDDAGEVIGAALAFVENSRHRVVDFFNRRMSLFATPVVKGGEDDLRGFLVELEDYCRGNGIVHLSIESYASPDISDVLSSCGYALIGRYEFVLDLVGSEEGLWEGFGKTLRKNIRHAERSGVVVRELGFEESMDSLRHLALETADRLMLRKGVEYELAGPEAINPAAVFLEDGHGRFFSALIDGRIVSTSLFTLFNGVVCHILAGSSDEALREHASKLLMWNAVKAFRSAGASVFNMGGCKADATEEDSSEHGVYWFKKSFGTRVVECASGGKTLGAKRAAFFNLAKSILRA